MNIDQRVRLVIWPVTFFLFINTLAIILFVRFHLAEVEGSIMTSVFRIFTLLLSIAVSLYIYNHLKSVIHKEHEAHTLRMHIAHSISISKGITIILQDLAIGLVQFVFVFISGLSFWVIVNFAEGPISISNQVLFYIGYGTIILASVYVLIHRLGLAVLSIRK